VGRLAEMQFLVPFNRSIISGKPFTFEWVLF
jgi:hypothetical protein